MWDLIVGFGKLAWAIVSSVFLLYKQLSGIQNDILAAALGVSPFIVSILAFLIKKIKKSALD